MAAAPAAVPESQSSYVRAAICVVCLSVLGVAFSLATWRVQHLSAPIAAAATNDRATFADDRHSTIDNRQAPANELHLNPAGHARLGQVESNVVTPPSSSSGPPSPTVGGPAAGNSSDGPTIQDYSRYRIDRPRSPHVIVYTTSWCPSCRKAKAWLRESGIAYEERDIEADRSYARQMRVINPSGSIPTFDIEGDVHVGFSASWVLGAIDRHKNG